jgi:DNA modification methylase
MTLPIDQIINQDCLDGMADLDESSVDLIVTDPPYGYSFMGKDWDRAVPSIDIWKQCLRVLKPGAFAFVMSAPRLDVQSEMARRISEAGFDISFTPLYWAYATGFPKAMNIRKMVDKRLGTEREVLTGESKPLEYSGKFDNRASSTRPIVGPPNTPQAKALDGSYAGFQPKPAVEVIIVAMKPLGERTYVDQAMTNGKGITWLDDGRIPHNDEVTGGLDYTNEDEGWDRPWKRDKTLVERRKREAYQKCNDAGRFPANLLVSDNVLDDGKNHIGTGGLKPQKPSETWTPFHEENNRPYFNYGDSGGFSRYFSLDKWAETLPFIILPKASKNEKNEGCEGLEPDYSDETRHDKDAIGCNNPRNRSGTPKKNHHPTVKPLKLMSYLITIGSRPGDVVLDPFIGSGTTALAARKLARKFIGYEVEEEYFDIAETRLQDAMSQKSLFEFDDESIGFNGITESDISVGTDGEKSFEGAEE